MLDLLSALSELFSTGPTGPGARRLPPAGAGGLVSPGEVLALDAGRLRAVQVKCKCGKVHTVTPAAVIGEAVTGRLVLPAGRWRAVTIYAPSGRLLSVNLVRE